VAVVVLVAAVVDVYVIMVVDSICDALNAVELVKVVLVLFLASDMHVCVVLFKVVERCCPLLLWWLRVVSPLRSIRSAGCWLPLVLVEVTVVVVLIAGTGV
jgi:hypothetical protein